jgi:hypothetical protein
MKQALVVLNLLAAVLLLLLGPVPLKARRAQTYETYREFQQQKVLIERSDYDVEQKLRALAGDNSWAVTGFRLASAACLANAIALGLLLRKQRV